MDMNIDTLSTFAVFQDGSVTTNSLLEPQCLRQKLSSTDRDQGLGASPGNSPTSPTTCQPPGTGTLGSLSRYKTELCRPFEELGRCRYGDKCQFAHGVEDLRTVERHPKHKTELCRSFHTTGLCPYGARCHFIHNELIQQQKPQCTDLMSGYAGILAASLNQYRTPLMITLSSMSSPELDPSTLLPATRAPPVSTQCDPVYIPPSLRASLPLLSPPCPILSLEMDLGSIAQRRRQLRGSVDSPSEWSMSGSSLSSSTDSSSSSPITSFLDEAFSPPLTSSVFSPPIGQYLTSRNLFSGTVPASIGSRDGFSATVPASVGSRDAFSGTVPTSDSSVLMLAAEANRLPENLKQETLLQQVIPTLEPYKGNPQAFGFDGKILGFNPVVTIRSNLESSIREETFYGTTPNKFTSLIRPTMYLLTDDHKALNLIGQ